MSISGIPPQLLPSTSMAPRREISVSPPSLSTSSQAPPVVHDQAVVGQIPPTSLVQTLPSARLPIEVANVATGAIRYSHDPGAFKRSLEERGIELWAVRHGQSEVNARENGAALMCGHLETPLTELGKQQANDAAKALYQQLGGESWLREIASHPDKAPVIYTSPLSRAADTSQAFVDLIAQQAQECGLQLELPVQRDERLKEICFGDFEGRPVDELMKQHAQFGNGKNFIYQFPGGESAVDVMERLQSFFDDVKERHSHQPVLIYCHLMPVALSKLLLGDGYTNPEGQLQVKRSEFPNAVPQQLTRPAHQGEMGYLIA